MRLALAASGSLLLAFFTCATWGCGIVGPSCLERQQRGTVANIQGEVAAGRIASHLVNYGTDGSQNDVDVSWTGQFAADGPRIAVYATRVECGDFTLPPSFSGACGVIGRAGWTDGTLVSSFVLTHGRGNPETLGSPPQFKLWVVGDAARSTSYTIRVTWFYGPDC